MLQYSEIPKRDGVPVGRYRIRVGTLTETFHGCELRDGESTHPVEGRHVARMAAAFGERCKIEPWGLEDARTVWEFLESVRTPEQRMRAVTEAFTSLFVPEDEDEGETSEGDETGEQPSDDADTAPAESPSGDTSEETPSADPAPDAPPEEPAEDAEEPPEDPEGEGPMESASAPDDLDRMNRDALKAYAQMHELPVDLRLGEEKLRVAVRQALAEKPRA